MVRRWSSKIVPRMSLIVRSRASTAWSMRAATSGLLGDRAGRLQLQAGGEESLDDLVVQVAGDPLAVGGDGQLGAVADRLRPVECEPGLVGEGRQQRPLLVRRRLRRRARTASPAVRRRRGGCAAARGWPRSRPGRRRPARHPAPATGSSASAASDISTVLRSPTGRPRPCGPGRRRRDAAPRPRSARDVDRAARANSSRARSTSIGGCMASDSWADASSHSRRRSLRP